MNEVFILNNIILVTNEIIINCVQEINKKKPFF